STSGSIPTPQLRTISYDYLRRRGFDFSEQELNELFSVTTQRIGALIERTPGTFEFEVQPLREYFVGQFLYHRGPPEVPLNTGVSNFKRQRFEALVSRPDWLNVLRFFAGSFEESELGSLATWMSKAASEPGMAQAAYPRLVAFSL